MSSSNSSSSVGQWPPRRPSKRSKLRNGTFIIPTTGERSRRHFTLRHPPSQADRADDGPEDDMAPLLSAEGISDRVEAAKDYTRAGAARVRAWLGSPKGRGVLKCTLAYSIASLWTFWAPLSDTLGRPDGKHIVATITVYFHPARTVGSMIEASAIAVCAVVYAEIISILSMAASVFFGSVLGWVTFAHAVVLAVFIGGGFGFIGWVKQRLNNPSVNVGCTLASLAIIAVVTKENATYSSVFSSEKIYQVFKLLVFGIFTSASVSFLVWRVSARTLLRESMTKASTSLGDALSLITHGFLSGTEEEFTSDEFKQASAAWRHAYAAMTKNLKEAKYEYYFLGYEKVYHLDKSVYKSMEALAQSIGGLRSAAETQFELLKEPSEDPSSGSLSPGTSFVSPTLSRAISNLFRSGKDRHTVLSAIDEAPNEGSSGEDEGERTSAPMDAPPASGIVFRSPSDIFELFIALLGPSMKSLAYTLSEILRDPPFGKVPGQEITINDHFRQSLADALGLFNTARANALQELYRHIELGLPRSERIKADFEDVAAACGHFTFSLQTFGEEMSKYLDVLDDLKYTTERKARSWKFMLFWNGTSSPSRALSVLPFENPERESLIRPIRKSQLPRGIPDTMVKRRDTFAWQAAPQANQILRGAAQQLLRFLRFLARDDGKFRFGLKVGIGATLWAMFAFIHETRDTYMHWRGEWGLLSFMIVCSMTVGASNTTGFARFVSTVIGASCSVVNWNVSGGTAVPLMFLGGIVAFWGFFVMIDRGKAPLGRTALLAYNVSTLYAYSLSQRVDNDDEDEGGTNPLILEIAKHRAIAVTAGILWGLIVCRVVWPISARRKFKEGLSVLYLQMGLIWKRGPLAILLRSDASRSYLKSGEQVALRRYASRLQALRASAGSEFELRGPFPSDAWGRILASTNRVLDAFYAMSLVTQRRGRLSDGERALLLVTAHERALLCERICHIFEFLASSVMLEYPLTDAVPNVAGVRDRLLGKIFQFRKDHAAAATTTATSRGGTAEPAADAAGGEASSANGASGGGGGGGGAAAAKMQAFDRAHEGGGGHASLAGQVNVEERDYALLYAYALVTGQVAEELKKVGKEIESLFGVLDEELLLLQ